MTETLSENRGTLHLDPLAYVIGVQGMALMRAFAGEHDAAFVEERLAEIARLLEQRDQLGRPADLPLLTPVEGYNAWSASYDDPGNGLLAPDLARVTSMIEGHAGGLAIDIACGTGRYAEWLVGRGYQVIGVDGSPGMLAVARDKLPDVDFRGGDLGALPVDSESADLAVCALALTHVEDLDGPYGEMVRVLKPGGRLVVSDTHSLYLTSDRYPLVKELPSGGFGYLPGWETLARRPRQCRAAGGIHRRSGRGVQEQRNHRPGARPRGPARRPVPRPLAADDLGDDRSQRRLRRHAARDVSPAPQGWMTSTPLPGAPAPSVVQLGGQASARPADSADGTTSGWPCPQRMVVGRRSRFDGFDLREIPAMVAGSDVFDVFGHIDYPVRCWPTDGGPFDPFDYQDEFRQALRALAAGDRALEINTRVPLDATILGWWRDEGGQPVTFGSDAHLPRALGAGLADAATMAGAHGFRPDTKPEAAWISTPPR